MWIFSELNQDNEEADDGNMIAVKNEKKNIYGNEIRHRNLNINFHLNLFKPIDVQTCLVRCRVVRDTEF